MTTHNAEYYDQITTIYHKSQGADTILVGGVSGMSTANQHDFYGYSKYFCDSFSGFQCNYGIRNLCDALYHRYPSSEERWTYLVKHGTLMFDEPPGQTYIDLHTLVRDKNYLIIMTNQDMQFSKLLPDEELCYPQGTSHWPQCGQPYHDGVYPPEPVVRKIAASINDTRVPTALLPRCPRCGVEMKPWFRSPVFLEGGSWEYYMDRYQDFIKQNPHRKIVLLELDVRPMTPNTIKHPFSIVAYHWTNAFLVRINKGGPPTHDLPKEKTITLDHDVV